MTLLRKTLIDTAAVWAERQRVAQISIILGFVLIVCVLALSDVVSDILSSSSLLILLLLVISAHLLMKKTSWPYFYNVAANLLLSYICLAIYLSDLDVRIQMLLIPLLPMLLYFLNPLWLFNVVSLLVIFVLLDAREIYLQAEDFRFESGGLVLFAYVVVWTVLLIAALTHRRDRLKLQQYMNYDEENGILNPKALLSVLEKGVANTLRYEHKMSLLMFEFYCSSEREMSQLTPGYEYERRLLASVSANIRRGDTLAKWKSNSFVIIVPESNEKGSVKLLEKLEQIISNTRQHHLSTLKIHYGITVLQHESHTELLHRTELALEANKRQSMPAGI